MGGSRIFERGFQSGFLEGQGSNQLSGTNTLSFTKVVRHFSKQSQHVHQDIEVYLQNVRQHVLESF